MSPRPFSLARRSAAWATASTADRCGSRRCCIFPSSQQSSPTPSTGSGQFDLSLRRLGHRRRRLHDRHAHSIGLDRAHHPGKGRGDSVRYRHGADQFCGIGVGSIRWMAVRGHESILRARDGVQSRGCGERRRGRELLVISPFASSRLSSLVGLSAEVVEPAVQRIGETA
jgi:hypothetical protein